MAQHIINAHAQGCARGMGAGCCPHVCTIELRACKAALQLGFFSQVPLAWGRMEWPVKDMVGERGGAHLD